MKRDKIIYWVFTGILSAWMLLQAVMFTFNSGAIAELFEGLGMPTALIIPLGIAKFLAVLAILSNISPMLKKLAYVGLALDFAAAFGAHMMAGDGGWPMRLGALVVVIVSYVYSQRIVATA